MPGEHPTRDAGRRVRQVGLAAAVVVVMFVIVMVASAVQGEPSFRPAPDLPPPTSQPLPTTTSAPTGLPEDVEIDPTAAAVVQTLGIILMVLVAGGFIALLVVIARALVRAWLNRRLRVRDGDATASDVDPLAASPESSLATRAIRRGIAGALRVIDEPRPPSDAIVAAWIGLEESAADAGVRRSVSETPGEFALRIISRRPGIADEAAALLRLYERVRFGTYAATENDRVAARAALRRIDEVWR